MDRVIQVPGVHVADEEMQLAGEFGAKRRPIAFHDVAQVIMLLPIIGNGLVNLAGALVPNGLGITVVSHRTEDSLPNVPLLAGPAVSAEHQFVAIVLLHGRIENSVGLALFRKRNLKEWPLA